VRREKHHRSSTEGGLINGKEKGCLNFVIFDVDGTLVDSVDLHAQAWQETFRKFGKKIPFQDIRGQIGKGGDQLIPVFFSKEELDKFGKKIGKTRDEIFQKKYLLQTKPFPKVRELFERIDHDGKRIALASSAKEDELDHFKNILSIADLSDAETTAEDAEKSKPDPDIFLTAMKKLGDPPPEEVVVIGDTPYDAIGARKAKLKIIGVLSGGFPKINCAKKVASRFIVTPPTCLRVTTNRRSPKASRNSNA
jgi:HAD superfamily hydrolase (TIGR01549 family)